MSKTYMTADDIVKLQAELEDLKVNGRAEMAEKIRVAREFGDLSENAEYDIAKDEQAKMEAKILEIEDILSKVELYEKEKTDIVTVGSSVKIVDTKLKEEVVYEIVGTYQANPFDKKISNESPLGKELIGKKKGDVVTIKTKKGEISYKILKIS
ncbi:MAG: transcription elongation factor GreA [Firmicutes bacterium]|nr:transcription elongation factor GreA [Bacillota bacterium]